MAKREKFSNRVFSDVVLYRPQPELMRIAKDRTRRILQQALDYDVKISAIAASCYAQGIEDAAVSLAMRRSVVIIDVVPMGELLEPYAEMC